MPDWLKAVVAMLRMARIARCFEAMRIMTVHSLLAASSVAKIGDADALEPVGDWLYMTTDAFVK
jgi:hypothetical protein